MREHELIQGYLLGTLEAAEIAEFDRSLAESPELREEFRLAAETDAALREIAIERNLSSDLPNSASHVVRSRRPWWGAVAGTVLAASLLVAIFLRMRPPASVATLVSSEDAAWESTLPTTPGSELAPGTLRLKSGIATVRFHSGAEVLVEAPAEFVLVSRMRARLNTGAAVVTAPESAKGFVLETPSGYVIDHGTRFAVRVDEAGDAADFELIEGEIEVRSEGVAESLRLVEAGERATVSATAVRRLDDDVVEDEDEEAVVVRLGTNGRCGSAMPRFERRRKVIRPENLYVKRSNSGRWDFRSFFAFDLGTAEVDWDEVTSARVRLNLVPSDKGFASRLPAVNRFGVYGVTNPAKADWPIESTWVEAPAPEDGVLLGTFEIPRSQQRGTFGIEGPELLQFLRERGDQPVTFVLVRETTQIQGTGPGLTHLFASDQHPESVGPLLELTVASGSNQSE